MWKAPFLVAVVALYFLWPRDSFDPTTLSGKRVLVTGASSGIGEHLAYEYSKLGARVVIAARRADRLEKVAQKCLELGAQQAEAVVADMAKVEDRQRLVQEVESRLGGLDVLLLNHAIFSPGWWQGTKDTEAFQRHFEINFVSYVDLAAKTLPMLTESGGNIGVVSAVSGIVPLPGSAIASSTKFALHGFFHSLRQEFPLRDIGVSVTLAVIGLVDTEIVFKTDEQKQKMQEVLGTLFMSTVETPQNTALAIIRGVATKQPEIYFGKLAYFMVLFHKICPCLWERLYSRFVPSFISLI